MRTILQCGKIQRMPHPERWTRKVSSLPAQWEICHQKEEPKERNAPARGGSRERRGAFIERGPQRERERIKSGSAHHVFCFRS